MKKSPLKRKSECIFQSATDLRCLSMLLFHLSSKYLTKEVLEAYGDINIERQVTCTVKYADDLVLLAKAQMVLQHMIARLTEVGKYNGMELNWEKLR